jgi:hypothetical protein
MNKFKNISASTLIKTGAGQVEGVIINSHSSGTLKLWNALSATGAIICNTMTFAAGERFVPLYGATFAIGLYATIGGTADITIVYK